MVDRIEQVRRKEAEDQLVELPGAPQVGAVDLEQPLRDLVEPFGLAADGVDRHVARRHPVGLEMIEQRLEEHEGAAALRIGLGVEGDLHLGARADREAHRHEGGAGRRDDTAANLPDTGHGLLLGWQRGAARVRHLMSPKARGRLSVISGTNTMTNNTTVSISTNGITALHSAQ